jgi:hypothetical protein
MLLDSGVRRDVCDRVVGASYGNLPHVVNFGDQLTLMQIGIQVTAR